MKDRELVKKLWYAGPVQREHIINKLKVSSELKYVLDSIITIVECLYKYYDCPYTTYEESNKLRNKIDKTWVRINQYRHKIWNFNELKSRY